MDEDGSTEQKTWQVYCFGKGYVFRLHLNESREGFCQRRRGRSFHVDGLKTEKAREPTAESLVQGIWRLRVSEEEQRVREGAYGHRDKTEHACNTFMKGNPTEYTHHTSKLTLEGCSIGFKLSFFCL